MSDNIRKVGIRMLCISEVQMEENALKVETWQPDLLNTHQGEGEFSTPPLVLTPLCGWRTLKCW